MFWKFLAAYFVGTAIAACATMVNEEEAPKLANCDAALAAVHQSMLDESMEHVAAGAKIMANGVMIYSVYVSMGGQTITAVTMADTDTLSQELEAAGHKKVDVCERGGRQWNVFTRSIQADAEATK